MRRKITIQDIFKIAKEKEGLCLSNTYINAKTKLLWKCKYGHQWWAIPDNVKQGKWCPYCAGKKVDNQNSLKSINPTLAKEWHPDKNKPLTPRDVRPNSHKKVWWKCVEDHEWKATIASRNSGCGCPICSGRIATTNNCIEAENPALAKEWHPNKNENLTPKDVKPGSHKKVYWECKNGHSWQATVHSRSEGNGCPYCAGLFSTLDNCLETDNPELAKQWHLIKNKSLSPRDVTPNSGKRVWWKCKQGHEWKATISSRNKGESGCPYC